MVVLVLGWVHRPLYEFAPGFDRIRDPRRATILWSGVLPPLGALGVTALGAWLGRRWPNVVRPGPLALGAVGLLFGLLFLRWTYAWRRPELVSFEARLEANALHADLARRAEQETLFRVLDERDTRPKLKRTADLVRAGYGLQSVEGVLGNILVYAYDRDFVLAGQRGGPRVWGLMNARYVTAQEELDQRFLELEGTFERDPEALSPGSDGPFLYRNRAELPRAFLAGAAVALVDPGVNQGRSMLASSAWNPRRSVLVRTTAEALQGLAPTDLERFDVLVSCRAGPAHADLRERARERGLAWRRHPAPGEAQPTDWLFAADPAPIRRLADPEYGWRETRLDLDGASEPSWLVLAETYAIYPGWSAEVDGEPAELWVANGCATALALPAGAREVILRYRPPGLVAGLGLSLLGVLASLGALVSLGRRGGPATAAG